MLKSIKLQNFRSYKIQEFSFSAKTNFIIGPNASGKTNILEAILCLNTGKSYRGSDENLIRLNEDWARVDGEYFNNQLRSLILTKSVNKTTKKQLLNNNDNKKTLNFPTIIFDPNQLFLLYGSPELRRSFLDNILEGIDPTYKKISQDYFRVLKQRNSLLKQTNTNKDVLFPWNIKISQLAESIVQRRVELVNSLNELITSNYQDLSSDKKHVRVEYLSIKTIKSNYSSILLKLLEQNLAKELIIGHTLFGPHKDDFEVYLNNQKSSVVGSRGENRSLVLALKKCELDLMKTKLNENPIVLLDDVFSELDKARRSQLINLFKDQQTIYTTTSIDKTELSNTNIIQL